MTAPSSRPLARRDVLTGAAALWLVVVLLGQWIFVYHIAGFYGTAGVSGARAVGGDAVARPPITRAQLR